MRKKLVIMGKIEGGPLSDNDERHWVHLIDAAFEDSSFQWFTGRAKVTILDVDKIDNV